MNKKANVKANIFYFMIGLAATLLLGAFIWDQSAGSAIWSDYYAKEIARLANTATPGQTVRLDVHKATEIAHDKGLTDFNTIFEFNNPKNEICVKLSPYRKTCYSYFANVDITDYQIRLGDPVNILTFTVKEKPLGGNQDE